jgi:hypothetical protein
MRKLRIVGLFLAAALLFVPAQAGAARPHADKVRQTAKPIWTLAMDGSRVAYASGGKIDVWNTATGSRSVVRGTYGNAKPGVNGTAAELAIAGKRVAWLKDRQFGNTEEGEWLYTAPIGGRAHLADHVYRHGVDDRSLTTGGWIEGLAGSGKTIAVSTWKSNGTVATNQALSLVTGTGLRAIAGGPGAIVSGAVDSGHIAVLSSSPWASTNSVLVYSRTSSAPIGEVDLGLPDPETTGTEISLSGSLLVVLTRALHEPSGPTTVTLQVYDWSTGQLLNTWPVGIHSNGGAVSFAVHGQLAAVEGPGSLHLVDLTSGKDVVIGPSSHTGSPAAMNARGLVYAVNAHYNGPGKLVFVPTAKLLAAVS